MNYGLLVRKLELPAGFIAPARLENGSLVAHAISRAHLVDDVKGINSSWELIRQTRGGGWPDGPVETEFNFVDLVWHELEHRENLSFTYAVYDVASSYLGCCYFYPMGRRTELSEELLSYDVDVSWWVTFNAYADGRYKELYQALRRWLTTDFPFKAPYFSNTEIPVNS